MYNATNAATWLRSPPRIALRCNSTQRFVCYNASPRGSAFHSAPRLPAAHRASIQLNDLFINLSSRSASQRDLSRRGATHLSATQRFVYQFTAASLLGSLQRNASQRYSTICLLLRDFTLLLSTQRRVALFNSTICLSIYYYNAPFCIAPPRSAPRLNAPHINATN